MKIKKIYEKAIEFFREHKKRYGCTAAVERMLLSKINEEELESLQKMPVVDGQTQHVPHYDIDIPYVKDIYDEEERIKREIEARKHRNRPPRRK